MTSAIDEAAKELYAIAEEAAMMLGSPPWIPWWEASVQTRSNYAVLAECFRKRGYLGLTLEDQGHD